MKPVAPLARAWAERCFSIAERLVTVLLYPFCVLGERAAGRVRVPILMYHQVSRPLNGVAWQDCVSPDRFAMHIHTLLAAGYRVITLTELVRLLAQSRTAALKRCVVLTFDDGFRDQFVNAYPILRQHGLPATVFLIAGHVGRDVLFPHLSLDAGEASQRQRPASGWLPLSWAEIDEMAKNGIDIGSHSVGHRSLGCMGTDEAEEEIRRSKTILERRLGCRVDLFAYPFGSRAYGDFDACVAALVDEAGYIAACTTVVGTNGRGADPFALRRIPMEEGDGPFRVRCKLIGAYDWVGLVKHAWQRLVPRQDRVDAPPLAEELDGT